MQCKLSYIKMFVLITGLFVFIRTVDRAKGEHFESCTPSNAAQMKQINEKLTSSNSFFDFLNLLQGTLNGGSFCYMDRSLEEQHRSLPLRPIPCELNSNIENLFEPIKVFNVSLIVFYDYYFEKKGNPENKIKYMFKGVQELYDNYDVVNEIGMIKFYVIDMIRLNIHIEDVIFTEFYSNILLDYLDSSFYEIDKRVIQVWLTNARIHDKKLQETASFNRLEGLARTRSFCSQATLLVNCNSISKSIITIAHEIAHVFSANHDHENLNCQNLDQEAFIMSKNYSPLRNTFSALSRSAIHKFFGDKLQSHPECFEEVKKYNFTYEDVKHLKPPSLDEQCQDIASKKFKSFQPKMSDPRYCERLHCKNGIIEFSNFPVMNGTPCNREEKMVCCFGRCVVNCTARL